MEMFLILAGVYGLGCFFFVLFFLLGRWPALIEERDWSWPVIFLWPLLMFWPVYFLKRYFTKLKMRQHQRGVSLSTAIACVPKFVADAGGDPKSSATSA